MPHRTKKIKVHIINAEVFLKMKKSAAIHQNFVWKSLPVDGVSKRAEKLTSEQLWGALLPQFHCYDLAYKVETKCSYSWAVSAQDVVIRRRLNSVQPKLN